MYKTFKIFILIILIGMFIFPAYTLIINVKENNIQTFIELVFLIIFEITLYLKIKNSQKE